MGSVGVYQIVHDEVNSCILCKAVFVDDSALQDHFKNSCEFTKRLLTAETRNQLDEPKMHLLVIAINKVNLIFANNSQEIRYCVDVLTDAIVIKKTCTTEVEVDRVIEMCRNDILESPDSIIVWEQVGPRPQTVLSAPPVRRCSSRKRSVPYNRQLQTPIVQKPVMQQTDLFYHKNRVESDKNRLDQVYYWSSVDKNVGEDHGNCFLEELGIKVGMKKSEFNDVMKKSDFNVGMEKSGVNVGMEKSEHDVGIKKSKYNKGFRPRQRNPEREKATSPMEFINSRSDYMLKYGKKTNSFE